jgi:hypothetical protein
LFSCWNYLIICGRQRALLLREFILFLYILQSAPLQTLKLHAHLSRSGVAKYEVRGLEHGTILFVLLPSSTLPQKSEQSETAHC